MANVPPRQGNAVSYSQYDLGSLVRRYWGPAFYQPDMGYQFSNGRRFDASDRGKSGVYASLGVGQGVGYDLLVSGTVVAPGMRAPYLLTEDGRQIQIT